jgi:hypothetical protein
LIRHRIINTKKNNMNKHIAVALSALVSILVGCGQQQTSEPSPDPVPAQVAPDTSEAERMATVAAESWLVLLDEGKFAESWTQAASLFKRAVPQKQWESAVGMQRRPLGRFESRTLIQQSYATSLPGAPDGKYVVIQYQTDFTKRKGAVETITPMLDEDGTWRVSGYFIK